MTRSSEIQSKRPSRTLLLSLVCLLGLFGAVVLLRLRTPHPVLLTQVHGFLTRPEWHDGSWYWLEGASVPGARLVRVDASSSKEIATAETIRTYAYGEGKLAWIASEGGKWTVMVAAADGSGKQSLRSGDTEPEGLAIAEGRVFWMEPVPAPFPQCGAFPPMEGHLHLVSAPLTGGAPTVIATLMETTGEQVIGVHDGQVYLSTYRPVSPGATAIYRAPLTGGNPQRLLGETARQSALLSHEGVLYWSAASRESSLFEGVVFIRRMGKEGHVEDLTDWLTGGGRLAETDQGVYYVDHALFPTAWPLGNRESLPRSVPLPDNYSVLAAGADELLMRPSNAMNGNFPVYRMPLP